MSSNSSLPALLAEAFIHPVRAKRMIMEHIAMDGLEATVASLKARYIGFRMGSHNPRDMPFRTGVPERVRLAMTALPDVLRAHVAAL